MKILALDLGDKWVGAALSDALRMTCKPYDTVEFKDLSGFLSRVIPMENISVVIVGHPKTFAGQSSEQTLKIEKNKEELERTFSTVGSKAITWLLWDERLTSKRADELKRGAITPEAKKKNHAVAAAFILQSYLDHLAFQQGA